MHSTSNVMCPSSSSGIVAIPRFYKKPRGVGLVGLRSQDLASLWFSRSAYATPLPVTRPFIDWPALLDHACRLQLKGWGRVLRSNQHGTAIEIESHEFYIRKIETVALSGA